MTITVLMVAEKPMLAESIAKLLSDNKFEKRKGFNGACSVSEYYGNFMGKSVKFKVTSTCGHIMTLDFPMKYNNWEKTDPVELYSAPTVKLEANPKLKMNDYLASEAKGAEYLVLWLDCDKEGENICFEVIDAVQHSMKKPASGNFMDNVYRAHFSAITEKDIKAAMRNLGRPNRNEALSVDARQELDLRVGCSFTRFQTKYFQGKYGDLDSTVISYGPCQTPTLGFCVTRHDQITQFKPEPYWVLQTTFLTSTQQSIRPEWQRGRIFDREVAQLFVERIKKAGTAEVKDIVKKESRRDKPSALNTVELMRIASSSLGLSPATTMSVAEHLYTQGFISYPRTETTSYPKNFDLHGTLEQQTDDRIWGDVARKVLNEGIKKPKGGVDKGDHPPITPMKRNNGQLSGDMSRIYEYVVRHFIATLMGPCISEVTTIHITCNEEQLSMKGSRVIDPGFLEVLKSVEAEDESSVPTLKRGESLTLSDVNLAAKETSPPGYLTESELISLMEKHGIGTDASIPVHINTVCQRNYVTVESGRRLIPTKLGISLVHGYWRVDRELVLPTMRAEVETQLCLIAQGEADFFAVKHHALEMFRTKFIYYVKSISSVDSLFEASFTSLPDSGKPFSKCGKCRRFMKLVQTKPQRLYCVTCQETYSVPNGRDVMLRPFGEKKCPIDDFELLYAAGPGGKLARNYVFCPYCFNNPPFESMKEGSGCDLCEHPSCPQSFIATGLCGCIRDCGGVLVLDPNSKPKWRFCCNKCASVVAVFDGASKLKVTDNSCEECNSQLLNIEYKDSPKIELPDQKLSWKGCVFCDEGVKEHLNLHHAYMTDADRSKLTLTRGRGRGGRGGRGRGRGGKRGGSRGRH
ncbi:unnamed protein product [Auanema sp. JU1783]|nr:unnamed protein product [Auanema sp. JU1783]